MRIEAELLHADGHCRVVRVCAHGAQGPLGSALGEAATAEDAEERALARLLLRLGESRAVEVQEPNAARQVVQPAPLSRPSSPVRGGASQKEPAAIEALTPAASAPLATGDDDEDPNDWSADLALLDLQLNRLGWDRDQESIYLQRAFGHPSRSRLTNHADLLAYLHALEELERGHDPAAAAVPMRRVDLLAQCDQLISSLGWDTERARTFLEQRMARASRQQLGDRELLAFNMFLESELIGLIEAPAGEESPVGHDRLLENQV